MSDEETSQRPHRGAHPADEHLFAPAEWPRMQAAVVELSWLLTRGDAMTSALKLAKVKGVVVSSDSVILDRCKEWVNLGDWVVRRFLPEALRVDLEVE